MHSPFVPGPAPPSMGMHRQHPLTLQVPQSGGASYQRDVPSSGDSAASAAAAAQLHRVAEGREGGTAPLLLWPAQGSGLSLPWVGEIKTWVHAKVLSKRIKADLLQAAKKTLKDQSTQP